MENADTCDLCGITLEIGMYPGEMCKGLPANHGSSLKARSFTPVEVEVDGKKVTISSFADVRRIERESERKAANGEGTLSIFRAFSQDQSNQDRNALGENPAVKFPTRNRRGMPYIIRKGDQGR